MTTVRLEPETIQSLAETLAKVLEGAQPKIDVAQLSSSVERALEAKLIERVEAQMMPKVERKILTILVQTGQVPTSVLDEYETSMAPKRTEPDISTSVLGKLGVEG